MLLNVSKMTHYMKNMLVKTTYILLTYK